MLRGVNSALGSAFLITEEWGISQRLAGKSTYAIKMFVW